MCKYNNTCIIHFPSFRLCYEMLLVLNNSRKMNLFHSEMKNILFGSNIGLNS